MCAQSVDEERRAMDQIRDENSNAGTGDEGRSTQKKKKHLKRSWLEVGPLEALKKGAQTRLFGCALTVRYSRVSDGPSP